MSSGITNLSCFLEESEAVFDDDGNGAQKELDIWWACRGIQEGTY